MFKIPPDIEKEIQDKYPTINVQKLIHSIFEHILNKCFSDGCCTVREFGKFICYKVFSNRLGRDQIRFKFQATLPLLDKIRADSYLSDNIKFKQTNDTKEVEERCKDKKDQRDENYKARLEARRLETVNTKENLAKREILKMIEDDDNELEENDEVF